MIIIFNKKATGKDIDKVSEDFDGFYIKVVADIKREILAAGGERTLLENGSKQADLWGGGVDVKTGEIDYNSMINLRPNQNNTSREIMSVEIRHKFDKIVRKLLI